MTTYSVIITRRGQADETLVTGLDRAVADRTAEGMRTAMGRTANVGTARVQPDGVED